MGEAEVAHGGALDPGRGAGVDGEESVRRFDVVVHEWVVRGGARVKLLKSLGEPQCDYTYIR